jgi:hypothetical protein
MANDWSSSGETGDSRKMNLDFGRLDDELAAEMYPIERKTLLSKYGDHGIETASGSQTVRSIPTAAERTGSRATRGKLRTSSRFEASGRHCADLALTTHGTTANTSHFFVLTGHTGERLSESPTTVIPPAVSPEWC